MRVNLVFSLMCMVFMQLPGRLYGQQRITLNERDIDIMQLLKKIEKQSGYTFFFNKRDVAEMQPVSIRVHDVPIDEALREIFEGQSCGFVIQDKIIVLTKRKLEGRDTGETTKSTNARSRQVSGVVVDSIGRSIPGVSVLIKGTRKGIATNTVGEFKLAVDFGDTLVFQMVGYEAKEQEVRNQSFLKIELKFLYSDIDEVIAVGYGMQRKKMISSAITSIGRSAIADMIVTGVDKALQGKVPGVAVTNNSGEPGSGVTIRIRGTNSIGSGNDPLYVVDGVPLENTQTNNINVGQNRVNGMSHINPADIESVEILKDAAATSIYGARAANGVVLITTKRGKEGLGELTVDYHAGLSNVTGRYALLDAAEYARMVNEGRAQLSVWQPEYSPYFSESFIQHPTVDTDWQDEIFRTAAIHEGYAAFRGGTEKTRFLFSTGYTNQDGIIIGTNFKRFNMRANIDHEVGKRLVLGTSLYAAFTDQMRSKNDGTPVGGSSVNNNHIYGVSVLSTALVKAPTIPVYLPDGTFSNDADQRDYGNPVRQAIGVDIDNGVTRIIGTAHAKVGILPGFSFRSQLSGDIRSELENWLNPPQPNPYPGTDFRGQGSQRTFNQTSWYIENYFNYQLGISNHRVDFLTGSTVQQTVSENSFMLASGMTSGQIKTLNGGATIDIGTSDKQSYGIVSFFGRINYDYRGKYLLLVNARYDGSSRFGRNNRYGFFPSASVGWRISDEAFMESVNFLDDWKLRASYGLTGNQEIGNYVARGTMVLGTGTNLGNNYTDGMGGTIASLPSPDLKWEETAQFNIGTDVGLFGNRLRVTADHYVKTTRDLLFQVPLAGSRGVGSKLENIGSIENRGIELGLAGTLISNGRVTWWSDLNVSTNANKVLALIDGADVIAENSIARVGEPISFFLYEREEFVDPSTGIIRFVDQNGNGVRDDADRILAGSPFPRYFGGFTNELSYKNIDFAVFFQFSYGNSIYNITRSWVERLDLLAPQPTSIIGPNVTREAYHNRWRQPGDQARYPRINYVGSTDPNFNLPHTGWLEDGSYLRLKSVTLGYSLPSEQLSRWGMKSARVYFTGNNLVTWTKYKGFDPEVDHFTGAGFAYGYDNGTYPQAAFYQLGISCTF